MHTYTYIDNIQYRKKSFVYKPLIDSVSKWRPIFRLATKPTCQGTNLAFVGIDDPTAMNIAIDYFSCLISACYSLLTTYYLPTTHDSLLTTDYSLPTQYSLLTAHHSLLTTLHSLLTTYSPLNTYSVLATHYLHIAHYSILTQYSLLTTYTLRNTLFDEDAGLGCFDTLMYNLHALYCIVLYWSCPLKKKSFPL